jgi:D-methionine transport system ATP-binding protein
MSIAISLKNVKKTFTVNKKPLHAVDGASLDINEGEIFSIIGYSGAGKSTLVRLINQLERCDEGSVEVFGEDIAKLSEKLLRKKRQGIGMIFQNFNLFSSRTVFQNIEFPLKIAKVNKDERIKRVNDLLKFVGLEEKSKSFPNELSGGQKQRVGIARALALNPKILLADEATSALDPETTIDVLRLLAKVNKEFGVTIVVITHTMTVVKMISDRVGVLDEGKFVEIGTVNDIFENPIHPTTQKLININKIMDEGKRGLIEGYSFEGADQHLVNADQSPSSLRGAKGDAAIQQGADNE